MQRADATLAWNGRVAQVDVAETDAMREALRNALVRIDALRSERDDERDSSALWRGLVSRCWTLVEYFERNGRRYYLAHQTETEAETTTQLGPELERRCRLTQREAQALGYAELGHSNKLIADTLGVSISTVSTLVTKARRKLAVMR